MTLLVEVGYGGAKGYGSDVLRVPLIARRSEADVSAGIVEGEDLGGGVVLECHLIGPDLTEAYAVAVSVAFE